MVFFTRALVAAIVGLSVVSAHPGHDVKAEAAERAAFLKNVPKQGRSLGHCADKLKARGVADLNVARRESAVKQIRQKRGLDMGSGYLKARDLDSTLATDHESDKDVNPSTDANVLFADGGVCIVQPEVTQGPYYVAGELVRFDVREDQQGVPLFLDIQLIDTNTCEPMPRVYTDIWHCNATGVYSGVVANGNGNTNDESNENTTFLRGVQPSGGDGVVRFETIFPGHYTGRAVHIHVVSHPGYQTQVLPNGTLAGLYNSRSSHVGQIFLDQDIITEVEKTSPYNTNTQELTKNSEDSILETEADTTDPFMEYVLLGDSVSDGVFAWISLGINATRDDYLSPEGYWTEEGGEENDNFSMNMAGMNFDLPTGTSSAVPSASSSV